MPCILYEAWNPDGRSLDQVRKANQIITEYQAQGFDLTLRQLYYQMVARGWRENTMQSYKRLGDVISRARRAGLIDWNAIVDRTRHLRGLSHWDGPEEILAAVAQQYNVHRWEGQPNRIEVWIEKDALVGVFEPICQELDVPVLSCRGYPSDSEVWGAAMRLCRYVEVGNQVPVILHFGDHDPSGVDMSRDIEDRLRLFGGSLLSDLIMRRVALNFAQVQQYNPPSNPAKETDSRFVGYEKLHGNKSWELDALEPTVLAGLVRKHVSQFIDQDLYDDQITRQTKERKQLQKVSERWIDVEKFVRRKKRVKKRVKKAKRAKRTPRRKS